MLYDEKYFPIRISPREIVAAWACCGLVALGAMLAEAVDRRDSSPVAAYAGVRIPSGGGMSARNMRSEDGSDDAADEGMTTYANREEAFICSTHDPATYSKPPTVLLATLRARSIC